MNQADIGEPPAKKRRFFADDSPLFASASDHNTEWAASETPLASVSPSRLSKTLGGTGEDLEGPSAPTSEFEKEDARNDVGIVGLEESFDIELFSTIVGEQLPFDDVRRIRHHAQDDLQRAVNIYFDGSWRAPPKSEDLLPRGVDSSPTVSSQGHAGNTQQGQDPERPHSPPRKLYDAPESRYIGAFGVAGWATRSGSNFIGHGQEIRIERQKTQTATSLSTKSGKSKAALSSRGSALNKRNDIIVRFTNSNGEEIGRLPKETASWVSTLIDQGTCRFQGTCVYAPEKIRTNDTIYLQLRAFILKGAFEPGSLNNLADNNRTTGIFEAKETDEEKRLRLRQVALVKLFEEINLNPSRTSETTQKHKRQGLLRAAEIAEQYDQENGDKGNRMNENDGSSPPSDGVEDGKELEQDQLDSLYKKAQSFDFNTPTIDPPETFIMDLRQYQKQALYWMVGKEKDEQTQHRAVSMHPLWEEYTWPTQDADDSDLPEVADQSKFYVNFYSGELSLDFPVQEQQCPGGILADEMGLGKTIEMLSLMHSHKPAIDTFPTSSAFNGLPRMPKKSQDIENAPCTTLVIAPMSLLAQWQSEAEKASKQGTLKTLVYYGNDRSVDLQTLCCTSNAISAPNLVITSYGTVLSEYNQAMSDRASYGGLFSLNFFRIILDEAHHIKNRQSKTAKACYELQAEHRWCLTGTPIVNRLEDLFSLVRFLKVEPWSNFSFWKTFITTPFEAGEFIRALDVVQTVLEPLVLRRTKDMKTPEGQALVPLPPRTIQIEEIELSKPEREVYDYIFTRAKRTFAANVEAGTLLKSYTTIFAQILRLRQSCCHPTLTRNKAIAAEEEEAAAAADAASGLADDMDLQVLINQFMADDGDEDANKFGANVLQQIQEEADNECPICSEEPMIDQTVTSCWHSACKKCLLDYIDHQRDNGKVPICFNCREPISQRDIFEVVRHDDLYDEEGQQRISLRRLGSTASAKIAALIAHLKRLRKEDPTMKSVVFSQFTSFLDLIEPALTRDHIPFLRFDGSMAQKQRAAVLNEFASSNKGVVFLLSLRAGGVGLNLTHAKRVFMMDPWWSFAVEAQAIDRVHRMGQEDPVTIHRFIVKESVEGRMLKIQDRKKFIASSLGMMSDEEKKLQRIEDIRELLS